MTWLLAFKLFTVPVLVALVSIAARRFGAVMGGLIMGLPWMTGPVLFILTFEKGIDWFVQASIGATAAPVAIAAFLLGFAWTAHLGRGFSGWALVSIVVAAISFGLAAFAMTFVHWTAVNAAASAAVALLGTRILLPKPIETEPVRPLPWWDIPVRMTAAGLMVLLLNVVADIVTPSLSGIIASYPVIMTSVIIFMLVLSGADAVIRLFRGVSIALFSFVVFFSVTTELAPIHGMTIAFAVAVVVGLCTSAIAMWVGRRIG